MKVKARHTWEADQQARVMDLAELLQPSPFDAIGELEQLEACVRELSRTMGKLLAYLVEKRRMPLATAQAIVNNHMHVLQVLR